MAVIDALAIDRLPGETRVAWLADERLVRLDIERSAQPSQVGAVHRGRVIALVKSIKAAFVDIGSEHPAFLELGRASVNEGQALTVRVTRDAHADKGPRVVREADPTGDGVVPPALLRPAPDLLARVLAEAVDLDVTVDGAAAFAEVRGRAPEWRLHRHEGAQPLFETLGIEEQIDTALAPRFKLLGGGAVSIEATTALTAIDIDGGGLAPAEVNREALIEIARQIRLRRLAGQIVIDLIAVKGRQAAKGLVDLLRGELTDDPDSHVLGLSGLGLIEMTRKRGGPSLAEQLGAPCPGCGRPDGKSAATVGYGALRAAQATGRVRPGRLRLKLASAVAVALLGPLAPARAAVEHRLGGPLILDPEPDRPVDRIELIEE